MPAVFVLGPGRWQDSDDIRSKLVVDPLTTRRRIAAAGPKTCGIDAIVMEDEVQQDGETHTQMFHRLVVDRDVQGFLIVLPTGCRLLGLEKEFGVLLEWLSAGWLAGDQVFILAESSTWQEQGVLGALDEPGNRTRYHQDFAVHDVHIRLWSDEGALMLHALSVFSEIRMTDPRSWYQPLRAMSERTTSETD